MTEPLLVKWKESLAELKLKNRTMTCEDSLITATALFDGHTIATHNKRHFEPGVPPPILWRQQQDTLKHFLFRTFYQFLAKK
jgi:hypothetical protein